MNLLWGVSDKASTIWVSVVMIWLTELVVLLKLQKFPSEVLEMFSVNIWSLMKENQNFPVVQTPDIYFIESEV